jgi:hypothetical protein
VLPPPLSSVNKVKKLGYLPFPADKSFLSPGANDSIFLELLHYFLPGERLGTDLHRVLIGIQIHYPQAKDASGCLKVYITTPRRVTNRQMNLICAAIIAISRGIAYASIIVTVGMGSKLITLAGFYRENV